jgi:hypothetical protein
VPRELKSFYNFVGRESGNGKGLRDRASNGKDREKGSNSLEEEGKSIRR